MNKIIRLTESDLHRMVVEAVNKILQEDGEGAIGGGGATNCVGINVGGAEGQAKNHIDASPFKKKKKNGGFLDGALDRSKGFSMGNGIHESTDAEESGDFEVPTFPIMRRKVYSPRSTKNNNG